MNWNKNLINVVGIDFVNHFISTIISFNCGGHNIFLNVQLLSVNEKIKYKKQIKIWNVDENCQSNEEYSNNRDFECYQTRRLINVNKKRN